VVKKARVEMTKAKPATKPKRPTLRQVYNDLVCTCSNEAWNRFYQWRSGEGDSAPTGKAYARLKAEVARDKPWLLDPVPKVKKPKRKPRIPVSKDSPREIALQVMAGQDASDPVCARCGDSFAVDVGADPSALCHPCAQEAVIELAEFVMQVTKRKPRVVWRGWGVVSLGTSPYLIISRETKAHAECCVNEMRSKLVRLVATEVKP
jgi:hypothetical protein